MAAIAAMRQLEHFKIAEIVFDVPTTVAAHAHEAPHLALVVRGRMMEIDGRGASTLGRADGIAYPGATWHRHTIPSHATAIAIQFDDGQCEAASALASLTSPARLDVPAVRPAIDRLRIELRATSASSTLRVASIVWHLIADATERRESDPFDAVKRYIDSALSRRIEVRDVARFAGYSPSHFARLFRQHSGTSIGSYVRAARAAAAARELETTADELADIATRCGYSDQSHFTNAFRAVFGISPGRYRRSLRRDR